MYYIPRTGKTEIESRFIYFCKLLTILFWSRFKIKKTDTILSFLTGLIMEYHDMRTHYEKKKKRSGHVVFLIIYQQDSLLTRIHSIVTR